MESKGAGTTRSFQQTIERRKRKYGATTATQKPIFFYPPQLLQQGIQSTYRVLQVRISSFQCQINTCQCRGLSGPQALHVIIPTVGNTPTQPTSATHVRSFSNTYTNTFFPDNSNPVYLPKEFTTTTPN